MPISLFTQFVFLWGSVLFLSLAAALRWFGHGKDYYGYNLYYLSIPDRFNPGDTRFEPGFHLLAWIFRQVLDAPYWVFAFTIVGTSLALKAYIIRRYLPHWAIAFVAYVAIFYSLHEYTQIRTAISLAFGYLALHLWMDEKRVPSILMGLIAFSFHYSSVALFAVFLPIQVFRNRGPFWWCGALACALAVFVVWSELIRIGTVTFGRFNPLLTDYVNNVGKTDARPFSYNNIVFNALLIAGFVGGWSHREEYRRIFFWLSVAAAVSIFLFVNSPLLAQRFKEVFSLSVIFAAFGGSTKMQDIVGMFALVLYGAGLSYLAVATGLVTF